MSDAPGYDAYDLDASRIQDPPQSLWRALAKIGPGIILAGSIVGSGELLLTTALGAKYGFAFLTLVLYSCVIKVFIQLEIGRYAISSGMPTLTALDSLPGPRLRVHWLVWWWFGMLLATVFQLGAMVGGVAQAMSLAMPNVVPNLANRIGVFAPAVAQAIHERPEHPWAVVTALVAVLLLLWGGYKRIERVTTFLVASVTLVTVICVAFLPQLGYPVTRADLSEGFSLDMLWLGSAAIAAAFATFGITGVGASELYSYPYWCLEKGYAQFTGRRSDDPRWLDRARGWIRVMYLDSWVSMVVFTTATVAFYILGATVLHRQGLHPEKDKMIETLSQMYVPAFGTWTKSAFLIGVWAVLFKTLYVASASHSRLTADFFGLAGFTRYETSDDRARWIRRGCVFFPVLALILYFWLRNPKAMVIIGGFFQAATLPVISGAAIYLRYRRTDPRLKPSLIYDICLWFAFLSITAVAAYSIPLWVTQDLLPVLTGTADGNA